MPLPTNIADQLQKSPRRWLVTGVAGFIGSNILEGLLAHGQEVVGIDNFTTGKAENLDAVAKRLPDAYSANFSMVECSILDTDLCSSAAAGCDVILHQAALGSVPQSIKQPLRYHEVNVTGTIAMLEIARQLGINRVVYASSSAVYGDDEASEKREQTIGRALSPYAVTKRADELYAMTFADNYGLQTVGLRYFNIFGKRQDPKGSYAAVIPKWIDAMKRGDTVQINGDGETSRDFCHVSDVVDANILAATVEAVAPGSVFNVGSGRRTTLNQLFDGIKTALEHHGDSYTLSPTFADFRSGDIRHSLADISCARKALGFSPADDLQAGLDRTIAHYGN